MPRLERLCLPKSETFWALGGRPGTFKTAIAWNLALNAAEEGHRVLFVTLEMTAAAMALRALSKFSGLPRLRVARAFHEKDRHPFNDEEAQRWGRAEAKLKGLALQMRVHTAESHGRDIDDIMRSASRARFDAVFVDHLGMIGRDSGGDELRVLSHAIHRLRGLSKGEAVKEYRPWVVATSQFSRPIDTADRAPCLADFRGSARIEHDTEVAIGLRPRRRASGDEGPMVQVDGFVLKNRDGPPDQVLMFDVNGGIGLVTEHQAVPDQAPP
jgi:replicative DNA helicase